MTMQQTARRLQMTILVLAFLAAASVLCSAGERVLEKGIRGSDVRQLQQQLHQVGYELTIDGIYGPETERIVKAFQRERSLAVDGIVGPETRRALRNALEQIIHVVKPGDSLYQLARIYGVRISDIMALNELTDDTIYVGQELLIPQAGVEVIAPPRPMVYKVQPGECAYTIARKFNTSVSALASANGLQDPSRLNVGQKLVIPSISGRGARESFIWPVVGRISSDYGWRIHPVYKNKQFHGGIDIAVPAGTKVRAAASGVVVQSGWMGGFGYGVEIDHGGGITTWYGHNKKVLVRAGQRVKQGQIIALSGSTGVSTGPHLDFRVKINGQSVDPLLWLPR